ncbi:hypothetical protein B0H17DRAFT_1139970 [Mycena rosella]|uniref:Uncharacterized protein n=1 Tax=Mycena rosella TaxID=1033263 RepID=A0AAD7GCF3_MYCRO|nr:hypothetical protein B0H17DRAFT_1139970 [Mycena rosella]
MPTTHISFRDKEVWILPTMGLHKFVNHSASIIMSGDFGDSTAAVPLELDGKGTAGGGGLFQIRRPNNDATDHDLRSTPLTTTLFLLSFPMATFVFPPGPLLRPGPQTEATAIFTAVCDCSWPWPADAEDYLVPPDSLRLARKVTIVLHQRANIHDDLTIEIKFENNATASKFCRIIKDHLPRPTLATKIYVLSPESGSDGASFDGSNETDSVSSDGSDDPDGASSNTSNDPEFNDPVIRKARILQGCPLLQQAVSSVLTSLAYTASAEILAVLVNWDASRLANPGQQKLRIKAIQDRFKAKLPPSVLILDGVAAHSHSPLPTAVIWADDKPNTFESNRWIPTPPEWPQTNPPPTNWVDFPITNYGIHHRDVDANQLADFFVSACDAYEESGMQDGAAKASLEAVTASLKTTVVRELAHVWVTEMDRHSPLRISVKGADGPAYDAAEDMENIGHIEAGLFVETAWLGQPQELACDQKGWLKLVVREPEFILQSPTSSIEQSSPGRIAIPDSAIPENPIPRLGSRFKLARKQSDVEVADLDSPPTAESPPAMVRICDPMLVARFLVDDLPLFPQGFHNRGSSVLVVTPTRRHKKSSANSPRRDPEQHPPGSNTVPPSRRSTTPSLTPSLGVHARPGLLGGTTTLVVAAPRAPAVKWPKVQTDLVTRR